MKEEPNTFCSKGHVQLQRRTWAFASQMKHTLVQRSIRGREEEENRGDRGTARRSVDGHDVIEDEVEDDPNSNGGVKQTLKREPTTFEVVRHDGDKVMVGDGGDETKSQKDTDGTQHCCRCHQESL